MGGSTFKTLMAQVTDKCISMSQNDCAMMRPMVVILCLAFFLSGVAALRQSHSHRQSPYRHAYVTGVFGGGCAYVREALELAVDLSRTRSKYPLVILATNRSFVDECMQALPGTNHTVIVRQVQHEYENYCYKGEKVHWGMCVNKLELWHLHELKT